MARRWGRRIGGGTGGWSYRWELAGQLRWRKRCSQGGHENASENHFADPANDFFVAYEEPRTTNSLRPGGRGAGPTRPVRYGFGVLQPGDGRFLAVMQEEPAFEGGLTEGNLDARFPGLPQRVAKAGKMVPAGTVIRVE